MEKYARNLMHTQNDIQKRIQTHKKNTLTESKHNNT